MSLNDTVVIEGEVNLLSQVDGDPAVYLADHSYNTLANKPKINSVVLTGDKSASDLGLATKSVVDGITQATPSLNIFDQASFTVTEGKYLNPNNGNVGTNTSYCYTNEYMPIQSGTTYRGTTWNKTTLQKLGYFNYMVCFYDANKTFISGASIATAANGIFTTPENAAYLRFSLGINSWNNYFFMFTIGSEDRTVYSPYQEGIGIKLPYTIVDKNGFGSFESINAAVQAIPDGGTIYVMPGEYHEHVEAWNKEVHIIGVDKSTCILTDASGNYSTPPLEIDHGSIQNMSIIEKHTTATITENMTAYGIHIEGNGLYNSSLLIKDCYIYSNVSAAIGMGLRGGCTVTIENCELVTEDLSDSPSSWGSPLYFHDADAAAYRGTANLYIRNCYVRNLSAKPGVISINSIHDDNITYMHFLQNGFFCTGTPKYNCWNTAGNTSADGWNGLSKMYLSSDSFGNNQNEMNYSA